MISRNCLGVAAAIGTEVLYGCSFAFTKSITGTIDVFTLLGWRFVTALAAMLVLMAFRVIRVRLTRAMIGPLLVLAVFQPVLYYVGETFGVMRTTASESGFIISAIPIAIILAAAIILRRRPTRWQLIGISVTLVGVAITVVAGGLSAHFDALGYAMLLGAVVSYALYATYADRHATVASNMEKTFAMVVVGAVIFGSIAVARHGAQGTLNTLVRLPLDRPDFAIAVAYLALGSTVGAFFLQNYAIGVIGSTRYSTFIGLTTVATLVTDENGKKTGAVASRDENMQMQGLLGGSVVQSNGRAYM